MAHAVKLIIHGEPASKANSRRAVVIGGKSSLIKSAKALSWQESALRQIPGACRVQLSGRIRVNMRIYYRTERPDLDESLILDVLQDQYKKIGGRRALAQRGVYCNDRQVREKHIYHGIDKANPRVVIHIEEMS